MLSRYRRLKYVGIGMLIIMVAMIFRQPRAWLAQAAVRHFIDPAVSLHDVAYYPRACIATVNGLEWRRDLGQRAMELHAARAWIVGRPSELLDGQIHIAALQLDEAKVTLSHPVRQLLGDSGDWQAPELVLHESHGEQARQCVRSLVEAARFNEKWSQRIDTWIQSSQTITAEIDAIHAGLSADSESWRNAAAVQATLVEIESLVEQQQQLVSQFDGIRRLLLAERKQLQKSFDSEMASLNSNLAASANNRSSEHLAAGLINQITRACWLDFVPYAEASGTLICSFGIDRPHSSYDQDRLPANFSQAVLTFDRILAAGTLNYGRTQTPFEMQGKYGVFSTDVRPKAVHGQFDYLFQRNQSVVGVAVAKDARESALQHVHLTANAANSMFDFEASGDGSPTRSTVHGFSAAEPYVRMDLHVSGETLAGSLHILPTHPQLDLAPAVWMRESLDNSDGRANRLVIHVAGEWAAPQFESDTESTRWLVETIDRRLAKENDELRNRIEPEIRNEFSDQLDRITALVARTSPAGTAFLDGQQQKLAHARQTLQARLQDLDDSSFAQRPGDSTTR